VKSTLRPRFLLALAAAARLLELFLQIPKPKSAAAAATTAIVVGAVKSFAMEWAAICSIPPLLQGMSIVYGTAIVNSAEKRFFCLFVLPRG